MVASLGGNRSVSTLPGSRRLSTPAGTGRCAAHTGARPRKDDLIHAARTSPNGASVSFNVAATK